MEIKDNNLALSYANFNLNISYFQHRAKAKTILFLHGLGCAKDDFYGSLENKDLGNYALVGIDFPGCGKSPYPENARFNIDDLTTITGRVIERLNLEKVILVGHSMGGLLGLLLAEKYPEKVEAFINVEGNLVGSDCFFSRKVTGIGRGEFIGKTFQKYIHKVKISTNKGLQEYAKILKKYSSPAAMHDVCPSLVQYSEE